MTSTVQPPMVGGSLSLDLVNTVWQRDGEPFDCLTDDGAVVDFTERNGHRTTSDDIGATRDSLALARALIGTLIKQERPGPISAEITTEIDAMLAAASVRVNPETATIEIVGQPAANRVAVAAVLDAIDLLASQPDRIRTCDHNDCTLWFVDTSKSGRRRWCSMETCGNRTKAKRHYEKATGTAALNN